MSDMEMTASKSRGGHTMRSTRWATVVVAVMMAGMAPGAARSQELGTRRADSATRAELAAARHGLAAAAPGLAVARAALATSWARSGGGWVASDAQAAPPEAWLQEDPASPLYQSAREALNRRRYEDAARMFAEIRDRYPRSGYVPDSYYWQAFALQRAGGQRNLRAATELLEVQADDHPEASTRADARSLMVRIEAQLARGGDADAAEAIARQASGPCGEDQDARLAALSALMNMNAAQAVPILQEVLRSRDECSVELRRRAVFLIAQQMTDESVDVLLDLAHRNPDPDREVREQAVFWLHQVDTPEALDALQSILMESEDEELQERAIFAISQRSDARSAEILKDYAERSDVPRELRENAIFWISQNPAAGGAQYLMGLYDRLDDDELRERAIFGIAQTSSAEGRRWLLERARNRDESVELRKNALFWAGQMGGLEAADLQGLYDSLDDTEMKEQVIFVASQMRGEGAVDFLMEVATTDEDRELRERAIFWLGQSNDPRVAEFLLTLIRGGVAR
jgi:HEAT repeat protein